MPATPLITAPESTATTLVETLAYVEGYDAVYNGDYAYVAFKETDRASGAWSVRIVGKGTAGASFDPAAIRQQARAASAQGQPYFCWGYRFEPSAGDPRCIEFRVYVANGQATEVEMFLQLRTITHEAAPPVTARFAWPTDA